MQGIENRGQENKDQHFRVLMCKCWFCVSTTLMKGHTVWVKKSPPPLRFSDIFSQTVGNVFIIFRHLLYVPIYARLHIFIQLPPALTKLCHIKCDHPANFYTSLELWLVNLFIKQMMSLLTSCHIRHVCWHYKSVCSLLINFYEWVKYPTTTNCAKDQCPPNSPDLNPLDYRVWCAMLEAFYKLQTKPN